MMEIFLMITMIMVTGLIANVIGKLITWIPLAFIQIAAGMLLSLIPPLAHFQMQPELFLLIIIAPLLFNDSQNTKLSELVKQTKSTFAVAVILAIITIVVIGFVLNWRFGVFTLPLAIALSAIVTPTDAVAVKSVTISRQVPTDVMQSLEFESLFNDASGIVVFDIALTVLATNHFSLGAGLLNFGYVFFGGLLVGCVVGSLLLWLRLSLLTHNLGEATLLVPLSILTPFAVYLLAEHVGVSGILAVVATGMLHAYQQARLRLTSTRLQVVNKEVWTILSDTLNGFVFVILGLLLPNVVISMTQTSVALIPLCLFIADLIYAMMLFVRFMFVRLNFAGHNWHGRESWLFSLGGVHGTMTLAMAFSLPLQLGQSAFPFRTEIIFIAAAVIVLSLLVPAVVFPLVLPAKSLAFTQAELKHTRASMINYALNRLNDEDYDSRIQTMVRDNLRSQNGFFTGNQKELLRLIEGMNEANADAIDAAVHAGILPPEANKITKRLLVKYKHGHLFHGLWAMAQRVWFTKRRIKHIQSMPDFAERVAKIKAQHHELLDQVKEILTEATNTYLDEERTAQNREEIAMVHHIFIRRWSQYAQRTITEDMQTQLNDAYVQAFQFEYQYLQNQLSNNKISQGLAKELSEQVSSSELVQFEAGLLDGEV
ncbi:sodium:proton antiporter [Weissella fabalis]|uniref:Sodium:proton antiporter n=2 Tax=Periweissella fabalis TaxID=1070421 RepID=A0A7X6N0Q2_9LACO|nr:sodium:proton antiporter [Periweissella fabalis]NKZ23651.1 sodium:proton antiporter [Periweissella fabalis]